MQKTRSQTNIVVRSSPSATTTTPDISPRDGTFSIFSILGDAHRANQSAHLYGGCGEEQRRNSHSWASLPLSSLMFVGAFSEDMAVVQV